MLYNPLKLLFSVKSKPMNSRVQGTQDVGCLLPIPHCLISRKMDRLQQRTKAGPPFSLPDATNTFTALLIKHKVWIFRS